MQKIINNSFVFILLESLLIGLITILHYSTPTILRHWHELFKVLYFIPIIFAAFRFGLRGGVTSSLAVTVLYLPHIMFQWGGDFLPNLSRFLMIVLYNFVGGLTGFLWQQERTERNRYQRTAEQLAKSITKLEQETEKRIEFEKQLLSAERLSTLGELTANLAHEVRNPLGSIRGVAEILRDESSDNGQQKFIDILLKEVQRLDQVVSNYLSYAQSQPGARERRAISPIIESVLALVGPETRRRQIRIQTRYNSPDASLACDDTQMRQALLNVMLNAIAACADDGGEIKITASENEDGRLTIAISDNGSGLSKEAEKHLFEPFFTTKADGTGLGLAITKRIVESHGGQLTAYNNEHGGATILMEFSSQNEEEKIQNSPH